MKRVLTPKNDEEMETENKAKISKKEAADTVYLAIGKELVKKALCNTFGICDFAYSTVICRNLPDNLQTILDDIKTVPFVGSLACAAYAASIGSMAYFEKYPDTPTNKQTWTNAIEASLTVGDEYVLQLVQWLHEHHKPGCPLDFVDDAVTNGNSKVVEFIHKSGMESCTRDTFEFAAMTGNLKVVKYLATFYKDRIPKNVIDTAAEGGHLDVVKFLCEICPEKCSEDAMKWAFENEHFNVVKYLSSFFKKKYNPAIKEDAHAFANWLLRDF